MHLTVIGSLPPSDASPVVSCIKEARIESTASPLGRGRVSTTLPRLPLQANTHSSNPPLAFPQSPLRQPDHGLDPCSRGLIRYAQAVQADVAMAESSNRHPFLVALDALKAVRADIIVDAP